MLCVKQSSSVNRDLNLFSAVYEQGKRWNWTNRNPVRGIKRPKNPPHRKRRISDEEVKRIIDALGFDGYTVPIALSYRVVPQKSLDFLFGMTVTDINSIHIHRAMMGLYLAMSVFWFIGAFNVLVRHAALYSQIVFMSGVAAGRVIGLIVDGMLHWLMLVYLLLEIIGVTIGVFFIQKR